MCGTSARGTFLQSAIKGDDIVRFAIDHILIARILFTLTTLGWSLGTILADFNKTHATNPQWTGHARFHVVWQVFGYAGFGLLCLALLWLPGRPGAFAEGRIWLAAIINVIVFASFYLALFTMPAYGGKVFDKNGYKPFPAPVPLIAKKWDTNIMVFSIQVLLMVAGFVALTA
jgi:hypothetical protein